MLARSSLSAVLLSVFVGIGAAGAVGCTAPAEDVGEDGAAALSQGGTRALAALTRLVNGDEAAMADYGPPATMTTRSLGTWSLFTRLGDAGRIEGYLLVSERRHLAFVVDLADADLGDGLLVETAGVQMTGGGEDLAAVQGELLAELDTLFASDMPDSDVGARSLAGGLAPASLASSIANTIFRAIAKARVNEAAVTVKTTIAPAAASEGDSAAKLALGASTGEHRAVAAAANVTTKAWPNLFEANGPLQRALQGNTFVLGDDVLKVVRAKPPAQTVAIDIGPSGGVVSDQYKIAQRMQTYLTELIAKQKAQGKISTLKDVRDINLLDISPITTEPLEVARTLARSTGARHVFVESEATLAQRSAQAVVDKPFNPFKERAGGYFYYLGRLASDRIAAVGDNLRVGNLWGTGRYASASGPGNLVADHASIIFMRTDIRSFASPDLLVDRVVRLVSAGKRVVIIDGGDAAGSGTLGTILRHPRFQALSEADRALLEAI